MMREEFDAIVMRLNEVAGPAQAMTFPTDEEYKIIERVYTWYPFENEFDKKECAHLYFAFGMVIFYDMEKRATRMMELDNEIRMKRSAMEKLKCERMA